MTTTHFRLVAFTAAGLLSAAALAAPQQDSGAAAGDRQGGQQNQQADNGSNSSKGQAKAHDSQSSNQSSNTTPSDAAGQGGKAGQASNRSNSSNQAPEGFILVEEQVIAVTANEPQNHLLRAQEYLAKNDKQAAAAEVRIAAQYLDMQCSRSTGRAMDRLTRAANELRQAADHLEQGNSGQASDQKASDQKASDQKAGHENVAQSGTGQPAAGQQQAKFEHLDHVFARANRALAGQFAEKAKSEVGSQKAIMAGHDLMAAADSLQAAWAWSGQQKPDDKAVTAVADARRLAVQLLAPEGRASGQSPGQAQNHAAGEAQTAAAKTGPNDSGQGHADQAHAGRIPADASKTVDELTSLILQPADQKGQSEKGQSGQSQGDHAQSGQSGQGRTSDSGSGQSGQK